MEALLSEWWIRASLRLVVRVLVKNVAYHMPTTRGALLGFLAHKPSSPFQKLEKAKAQGERI